MAQERTYREDLQRDWTDKPIQPHNRIDKEVFARFTAYLQHCGVPNADHVAKELWRISRLTK